MKRILYTLIVLSTVWFTGCREDQLEGEIPGKEVTLTFSSRSSDLSSEALSKEINALHLLIFDENGIFSQQKEFAGLANVTPVKLPLGTYTFAYLSNVDVKQISGLTGEARLSDVVLSLLTDENGDIVLPGSIFSGTDKIVVGEDKTSDAALSRMVGRLDINVSGLKGGVELRGVTLLGSPKSVRFDGTVQDPKARLKVPMNQAEELMKGQAVAFPTCVDSLARLEFVIVADGETKTFVSVLKNKVEANKIHTINAKVNVSGAIFDVDIEMSVEEWGASESEDITASEKIYVNDLTVKFLMESGSTVDLNKIKYVGADFIHENNKDNFYVSGNKDDSYSGFEVKDDTLIVKTYHRILCGKYNLQHISLRDSLDNNLYSMPAPVKSIMIDSTGSVVIELPKMKDVATVDAEAMLALRDAMSAVGIEVYSWKGDNINLWGNVELNADGRVVRIGYSDLDDYEDDYDHSRSAKVAAATTKTKARVAGNRQVQAWSLPSSFQNLTELTCFNISDDEEFGVLTEIPASVKEMSKLEELGVCMNGTTIPELPVGLKYLSIESATLTEIPAHIGTLTKLQVLAISVPGYQDEDDYDYDYLPDLSQAKISSIAMDFSQLVDLKALYIVAGANCEMPTSLWNLPGSALVEMGLCGFSRIQTPASITKWTVLEDLSLANASMTSSDIESIKNLNLESLMIYSPVFGKDGLPAWMGGMSSIRYLTLYDCGITSIPESFNGLTNLRDLDMPRNPDLTGQLPSGLLERYNNSDLYIYAPESSNFNPDGISLVVTPEYISAAAEGGEYMFEVKTTAEWTCELNAYEDNFITVIQQEGSITQGDSLSGSGTITGIGNAKFKVKVKANMFGEWNRRTGYVTVRVGKRNSGVVAIEQEGVTVEKLETSSKDSCSVAAGDSFVLDVFSNTEWYIESELTDGNGYLYMEPSYGRGDATCKGVLEMPEDSSSCTIVLHLRSQRSDLEKTITVTGYRAN